MADYLLLFVGAFLAAAISGAAGFGGALFQILRDFYGTDEIAFRTPGAPLRPGSFTVRATALDGTLLTGSADINGTITGSGIAGMVDWSTGAATIRFGAMVTAAGNEGQPWYRAADVVGGQVWRPLLTIADSVYFGTVVYRSIPLSSVVVGLDPVRLPSDGRVVAYKPGQTVVVHHTDEEVLTPAAGQLVTLPRDMLSIIEVRDDEGTPIDGAWYTLDLDAGTVQWSDPLNLGAYVMPVHIRHTIADRRLVSDVQITGQLGINTGLGRDFPAGAYVSTALRLGEASVLATYEFTQLLATVAFGGMCVTGTIARTATNVRAGARGPISGMLHAVYVLLFMAVAAPLASYIPLAALGAVLAVVSWDMAEKHEFGSLLRSGRGDAAVLLATFLLTIFADLTIAIAAGVTMGAFLFLDRMAKAIEIDTGEQVVPRDQADDAGLARTVYTPEGTSGDIVVYRIAGAFFFGAAATVGSVLDGISQLPRVFILDFEHVPLVDSSAAKVLRSTVMKLGRSGTTVYFTGARPGVRTVLLKAGLRQPDVHYLPHVADAVAAAKQG